MCDIITESQLHSDYSEHHVPALVFFYWSFCIAGSYYYNITRWQKHFSIDDPQLFISTTIPHMWRYLPPGTTVELYAPIKLFKKSVQSLFGCFFRILSIRIACPCSCIRPCLLFNSSLSSVRNTARISQTHWSNETIVTKLPQGSS